MSKFRHKRQRPAVDDPRLPGLLGSIASALAAGLVMYGGWYS